MNTRIIISLSILLLILIGISFLLSPSERQAPVLSSFEDCVRAGNPVMESYPRQCRDQAGNLFVESIPDSPSGTFEEANAEFNQPQQISLNETLRFEDGLRVSLIKINDARCPEDAECIWEGEVQYIFHLSSIEGIDEEIQLSTISLRERFRQGYRFFVVKGSINSVTIQIEKNEVSDQGQNSFQ